MTAKTAPQLPADLVARLRRLKLSRMRELAPELLLTAAPAWGRRASIDFVALNPQPLPPEAP